VPNVLIVDDEPLVIQVARMALERSGYIVETATSSAKAYELAAAMEWLDLLIVDNMMPLDRGRDIAERLMRTYPEMRVMHISGWPREQLEAKNVMTPGAAFLPKPFTCQQLQAAVSTLLSRQAAVCATL
jgi:two-component system cell cycle sensor histidine kinase/response regulator CckA